ncbi:MAG: DUF5703 domain-containing protein, partial [Akkermansiaceae bacterium]|nr:DUF5703 domain-containing protein [Akkermansiaceae bacterium]
GLIRLRFGQPVFAKDFRQELRLLESEIVISGSGPSGKPCTVTLWCDADQPVVRVGIRSGEPHTLTVSYETWSNFQASHHDGGFEWVKRLPEENPRRLRDMKAQGMEAFAHQIPDPLSKLTLGGRLDAPGMIALPPSKGKFNNLDTQVTTVSTAAPVGGLDLTFTLRMEQDASRTSWQTNLAASAMQAGASARESRAASLAWWRNFWNRSHIFINCGDGKAHAGVSGLKSPAAAAWEAGRNYQLIRYMLAANTSGRAMTLFNGGNFTCTGNPDSRNWDGCQFMGQNQMLVYWPMMRSGDFDLLKVGADFYRDRAGMRRRHAGKFWDIEGITYPEPLSIFGLDAIGTNADGRSSPKHLHYHYTSGMVFALMMLGHDAYAGTTTKGYADTALGIISYYDNYYQKKLREETGKPLDANGKLVIYPSDACEPYHGCTNNIDVLAGLMALCRDLLDTPPGALATAQRAYVSKFVKRIPEFKIEEKNGRKLYAAADKEPEWIFHNTNMDFPQMYICFPFSAVSLGRSDMELVRNTWELGPVNATVQHQNQCWYQNAINLARMGDTVRASDFTLRKLNHPGLRFPAFYYTTYLGGGSFCHPPDTDHGGVAMTALQEMLMQTDGRRILLGPAWPADWDADFKLRAPWQTTVEGRVTDGKVIVDKVTPPSRRKDIEIFPLKRLPKPPVSAGKPATATSSHSAGYTPDKAVDGDTATRWASAVGQTAAWLEVDLGTETEIARAIIDESSYPQTLKFAIEALQADGSWQTIYEGGFIGPHREVRFPPVKARKFRLHVLDSKLVGPLSGVNINEFQLFCR